MKYKKKLEKAKEFGNVVTQKELIEIKDLDTVFYPYGCLNCGKAEGEEDFDEVRYVIYDDDFDEKEVSQLFGVAGYGSAPYGQIAKCGYCGHSEIFPEPKQV